MRKFLASLAILALAAQFRTDACTNVIVTPGASKDGSSIVSYAADSHWLYGELYFHPAARFNAGSKLAYVFPVTAFGISSNVYPNAILAETFAIG